MQLAPQNPQVQQIAEEVYSFESNRKQYQSYALGLTATAAASMPLPVPTQLSQVSATGTAAPATTVPTPPQPTAQETSTPLAKPSAPICGSALLLPLAFVAFVFTRGVKHPPQ